jgi:hypothetical protein
LVGARLTTLASAWASATASAGTPKKDKAMPWSSTRGGVWNRRGTVASDFMGYRLFNTPSGLPFCLDKYHAATCSQRFHRRTCEQSNRPPVARLLALAQANGGLALFLCRRILSSGEGRGLCSARSYSGGRHLPPARCRDRSLATRSTKQRGTRPRRLGRRGRPFLPGGEVLGPPIQSASSPLAPRAQAQRELVGRAGRQGGLGCRRGRTGATRQARRTAAELPLSIVHPVPADVQMLSRG